MDQMATLGEAAHQALDRTPSFTENKSDATRNDRPPTPQLPRRIQLERLLEVPSSGELTRRREIWLKAQQEVPRYETEAHDQIRLELRKLKAQFELAEERDAIQAERPTDCRCLGTGRTSYMARWNDSSLGEFCGCPEGLALAAAAQQDWAMQEAVRLDARKQEILEYAQIPNHFRSFTLSSFKPEPAQRYVVSQMERYAVGDGQSVFLYGDASRGKTGLAIAAARERALTQVRGLVFWNAIELLTTLIRHIRDFEDADDPVARAERVGILILDDIDKIGETDFQKRTLYDLINKRHDSGLSTVFTANIGRTDLAVKLGNWTVDRILEMCGDDWVMELKGVNRRVGSAAA